MWKLADGDFLKTNGRIFEKNGRRDVGRWSGAALGGTVSDGNKKRALELFGRVRRFDLLERVRWRGARRWNGAGCDGVRRCQGGEFRGKGVYFCGNTKKINRREVPPVFAC